MPIVFLFYSSHGLSLSQILTLQSVYSLAIVLFEIPSGYLADIWGRKNTLIIGAIFAFIGFLIYSLSGSFWYFLIAEIILGIGQSFVSGTDSAMLYDSLLSINQENKYSKLEGRLSGMGNFAEAIAGILGGFLGAISLQLPYMVQAGVVFIAIPAAMLLINPPLHAQQRKASLSELLKIVKFVGWDNKNLRTELLFSSIIGVSTLTLAWFAQPFFKRENIPTEMYGVIWAVLNLSVGISSVFSYKLEYWLSAKGIGWIILTGMSVCFMLIGFIPGYGVLAAILVAYWVRGIATPVLKTFVQRSAPSEYRATILSLRNFVIRILFAATGPFLGFMSDHFSLETAMRTMAVLLFLSALPLVIKLSNEKLYL
jgi:MFS family permease